MDIETRQLLQWGKQTLETEGKAVLSLSESLDDSFCRVIDVLLKCEGKVVFTGLGKSGYIAQKLASTFSSTGSHASYLHPAEALHGDFGMIKKNDCLFAIANSGETREVLAVVGFCKKNEIPVISVSGKESSSLSLASDYALTYKITQEADPLGLVPTTSSTVSLALGDALATTLMRCREFTKASFASLHPGGTLGRSLAKVKDFMRTTKDMVWVEPNMLLVDVLPCLNSSNFGIVGVLNAKKQLQGVISDGDLRRGLL